MVFSPIMKPNRFYRKPKPETMKKNREFYKENFKVEMEWFKENMELIKDNKFLIDMYTILITGSRKMTPKMIGAIQKAMDNPMYDPIKKLERMDKIRPILEKIEFILILVEDTDKDKDPFLGIVQWGCLQEVYDNSGKFCLPLTQGTQIPDVYGDVNIGQLQLYQSQQECADNTPCEVGTYSGPPGWLSSLPWPSTIDENTINHLQKLANIKKRG